MMSFPSLIPNPNPNLKVKALPLPQQGNNPLGRSFRTFRRGNDDSFYQLFRKFVSQNSERASNKTSLTVAVAIMGCDLLANGDGPEDPKRDVTPLAEELAVIVAIML